MVTLNAGGTLVKIFRHMHILLAKRKPSQQGDSIQLRFSQCCAFSFHSLQLFSSLKKTTKNKGGITKCATPPPLESEEYRRIFHLPRTPSECVGPMCGSQKGATKNNPPELKLAGNMTLCFLNIHGFDLVIAHMKCRTVFKIISRDQKDWALPLCFVIALSATVSAKDRYFKMWWRSLEHSSWKFQKKNFPRFCGS